MRRRAERNGGTLQLSAPASGGTHLSWTARTKTASPVIPMAGHRGIVP
jgi:hypothetical protein